MPISFRTLDGNTMLNYLNHNACKACFQGRVDLGIWCAVGSDPKSLSPDTCPYYLEQLLTLQKHSEAWIVPYDGPAYQIKDLLKSVAK